MSRISLEYELDLTPESVWLAATPSKHAKSALLHLQEAGEFFAGPRYYTQREGLESYLIKYTVSGTGSLEYQGQTYDLHPNQLFWIDCRNHQYYRTAPHSNHWQVLWVHFYGPASEMYYEVFQAQNRRSPILTLPPDSHVQQAMRALLPLYRDTDSTLLTDLQAAGLLTQLLGNLIQTTGAYEKWTEIPAGVQDAKTYLAEHYAERITLDDLARTFSVSKFHFQKQFKHFVGYTPNEYLLLVRLNHAKGLLRSTDLPVAQIAYDVGIQNVSHFINLFKKHEGTTPSHYRKNWPILNNV